MKYNLAGIMCRAWALRRAKGYTLCDKRYVRFGKPASEALKESMANARAARAP